MRARFALVVIGFAIGFFPASSATAAARSAENAMEERFLNEDIDPFDLLDTRARANAGTSPRGPAIWLSLFGFANRGGPIESTGAMAIVGIAFDKIAAPRPRFSQPPQPPTPEAALPAAPTGRSPPAFTLTTKIARKAILAAWRAAGLGVDDARLDAIVSRARLAALLPETRLRATHIRNDRSSTQSVPEESQFYDSAAANLGLEARLTWRLDRLFYADDEPTFERIRLDRGEARMRLAAKLLDALFVWQRACLDRAGSAPGTREELETSLRVLEAEITLDTMTDGWFSEAVLSRNRGPQSPKESLPRDTR